MTEIIRGKSGYVDVVVIIFQDIVSSGVFKESNTLRTKANKLKEKTLYLVHFQREIRHSWPNVVKISYQSYCMIEIKIENDIKVI